MAAPVENGGIFGGAGEVGRDLAAVAWEDTPLGPPRTWPQSLRTSVRILLTSRFSMWMGWGPELTFFCNEKYRRDTLGTKYPWALGRPTSDVWAEIWDDIYPRIHHVMTSGQATWDERLMLILERSGYQEETYHTFSYSPLTDDSGVIAGLFCVVSEDTASVISQRQMAVLHDLGATSSEVRSEPQLLAAVEQNLSADLRLLPFTATYLVDESDAVARLAATSGISSLHPALPAAIGLDEEQAVWPLPRVVETGAAALVGDLPSRFAQLPTGGWDEPPTTAVVVPLPQQGQARPYGALVVGVNRYRPLDQGYRDFLDLVASQVATGLGSTRAYAAERRRAERLAELDRAKTTFFTNVSHELRTPLTLLLGPAEDGLRDVSEPLPAAQRHRLELIERNGARLLKLVNTLLDFSRLESGTVAGQFEPVDLSSYTSELAETFRPAVERAGLTLTLDVHPVAEPTYVDQDMWAKIVLNLLSNALKFTFDGGITVSLRRVDGELCLAVTDTGIGIPSAEQGRLFERFHRVMSAQGRTHEGSGIGLALVAELAALHGGSVGVASTPGEGSTFSVVVPVGGVGPSADQVERLGPGGPSIAQAAQPFLQEAHRWLVGEEVHTPAPPGDRARVLVVDDNADMREYVAGLLSTDYVVDTAVDGLAGLDAARANLPDLVLTDVMMPRLDGFGLLAELRSDPATSHLPVVMISARAGEEATVVGLEAGADDYLVKPFSARELRARVAANLELDRMRRIREELERRQAMLDQTQRLARVGSWDLDLATGNVRATEELYRQVGMTAEQLARPGAVDGFIEARVHPEDVGRARASLRAAVAEGTMDVELRLVLDDGSVRIVRAIGETVHDDDGNAVRLRGSLQDTTEQRAAEQALAAAAAAEEAAEREHRIADELQRSLLPQAVFNPDLLDVATYYRAGVRGTQVGGDWLDVIELGAGRTALVIGDVMGRGVRAAAVMGQLRAAVQAYARLDLQPADLLEFLDGVVRELGDDQIVTCVYAVYDPGEHLLTYANAGHLPPLLRHVDGSVRQLTGAAGSPLGTGPLSLVEEEVPMTAGTVLALYTDGLVESRDRDLDAGIDAFAGQLEVSASAITVSTPDLLAESLLPDDPDDDVAVLLAQVHDDSQAVRVAHAAIPSEEQAVQRAREFVVGKLVEWAVPAALAEDIQLLTSELVTNAVIHGEPPISLRLRHTPDTVMLEVQDRATYLPRRMRPTPEDEHGRGLQLVTLLADRWGTRPVRDGKSVWCVLSLRGGSARTTDGHDR